MNGFSALTPAILACLVAATVLLALIILVRAAAIDARKRGKSPLFVSLLVLLSFPLGIIVWLIFRPEPVKPSNLPFHLKDHRVQ